MSWSLTTHKDTVVISIELYIIVAYLRLGNLGTMLKHSVITDDMSTSSVEVVILEMWYINVHKSNQSFTISSSPMSE